MCEWRADQLFAEAIVVGIIFYVITLGNTCLSTTWRTYGVVAYIFCKVIKILVSFFFKFHVFYRYHQLYVADANGGPRRSTAYEQLCKSFGTQCKFSCAIGYRLNGSSTVTCVAPGKQHSGVWNNTIPMCKGKQEKRKKDG